MTLHLRRLSIQTIFAVVGICWLAVPTSAQYSSVPYEQGVNAYFAGHLREAEEALSLAIIDDSQDPRAYYFRALTLLRQGHCDLARGDMLTGATLELQQPNRYAIGSALERVQGHNRLMIESFRRQARLAAASSATSSEAAPTAGPNRTFREGEGEVLRKRTFVPLEELMRPEGPRSIVAEPSAPAAGSPVVPPQAAPAATPPVAAPARDPFSDEAPAVPPQASPPPVPPQTEPQPTPPPAAEDENPFGG